MIERHITFTVPPEHADAFERFFAERYRPAMAASPGFVRVDLLREAEQATRYQMVLRFADLEASVGWRTSPVHQGLQPDLQALTTSSEVQAYEVVA
ncbi:MAG TPA: antibiotic biosynthesis monooxygenase family protein [Candidatus Sulfotelmatobacter sp.]|nr:antibiotic biosynthesis monooxygenase family protein [Candidatus Sulfotelmatobacter sp.]